MVPVRPLPFALFSAWQVLLVEAEGRPGSVLLRAVSPAPWEP
ncbi:hypothetical protein [Streptomyces sp. NBC_00236]|nr:hypothetical protein [Streptomyces sp. NBC_00236]